eukprot:CAMPEP_0118936314 /NCGR_PEP_ID=MMETSP1169-20130426/17994_1 /TAXON_ID=36882 /ORGANISM="Pyramimonas obovata, Strain CCMP722" /LENGTH=169 /DNA_ID=CAMNT_0006879513 /DNA_START=257 /DNA_END=766 /DNA_ORIENTATION=+
MGGSSSREVEDDDQEYYGIRINKRLLDRLDDRKQKQAATRLEDTGDVPPPPTLKPIPYPFQFPVPTAEHVERSAGMDDQMVFLRKKLQYSKKVGSLLIKHEDEELPKVQQQVKDLLDKQYQAPMRAPPCAMEKGACLACYQQFPNDPLRCAAAVAAFSKCAKQAYQDVL